MTNATAPPPVSLWPKVVESISDGLTRTYLENSLVLTEGRWHWQVGVESELHAERLRVYRAREIVRQALEAAGCEGLDIEWVALPKVEIIDFDAPRRAELALMPYGEYLQTPEWNARRLGALARASYRCQVCNAQAATAQLDVHHRTYARRGEERPEDLIVLCRSCHGTFHGKDHIA